MYLIETIVVFENPAGDIGEDAKNQITYAVASNFTFPHLKILFPTGPEEHYHAFDGLVSTTRGILLGAKLGS